MRKKFLGKALCLVLICTMLLTFLLGCADTQAPDESDTQTQQQKIELPIILAAAGGAEYSIVMSENVTDTLRAKVLELYRMMCAVSGASVKMTDDYAGNEAADAKEILIGNTAREESVALMSELGYFDSAVKLNGNKIVVAAHTEGNMLALIDTLMKDLIKTDNSAKSVTLAEEYFVKSEKTPFFTADNKLEDYVLIYPEGNNAIKTHANNIAARIEHNFGIKLNVSSDASAESDREILLGFTSRASAKEYYTGSKKPDSLHVIIEAVGNKLVITGSTEYSAPLACEIFYDTYLGNEYSPTLNFENNISELCIAHKVDKHSELSKDADIRIMSYNVLSKELSNTAAEFEERKDLIGTTILNYMPDVIGVQEVDEGAYATLEQALGDTYAFTIKKTPLGEYSFTSIMYNKNTVNYIEGNNMIYALGNKRIRLISWGVFEHKSTGERFIMVSTHWDIVKENRQPQAEEMTRVVNELRAKYNLPIITTGDFNSPESTTYYKQYLKDTQQTEARYSAEKIGHASTAEVIDHITSTLDVKPLFFKLLDTELTKKASDHNPIYADYKFK